MSESALTFLDLQVHVASKMGVAFYGAAGDEVAQAPTDTYTEQVVKDYVNGGIRMFLNDAPEEGWRFQTPVASITLWAAQSSTANGAPSYSAPAVASTVTAHTRMFYDSMVGHELAFTLTSTADGTPTYTEAADTSVIDVDDAIFNAGMVGQTVAFTVTDNNYTIIGFTDSTTVIVEGDASGETDGDTVTAAHNYVIQSVSSLLVAVVAGDASGEADGATITLTPDGNYTLPSTFGGEVLGVITYAAGVSPGSAIRWIDEGSIRRLRENVSNQTAYPSLAAIRKMAETNVARRYELVVFPSPGGDYIVEFAYELYFTELTADGDFHPAGLHYDEAIRAACVAYAEMMGEDRLEDQAEYYHKKALPAAHRRDRQSGPRQLGNLLQRRARYNTDWRDCVERPDVSPPS